MAKERIVQHIRRVGRRVLDTVNNMGPMTKNNRSLADSTSSGLVIGTSPVVPHHDDQQLLMFSVK